MNQSFQIFTHYLSVFDTSAGANRPPDDWQPRHNIKKQFEDETLKLQFIVDKELVREYLQHLVELQQMRNLRKLDRHQKRTEKQNKTFDDYDWELLVRNGQLQKLLLSELDKYLNKFNLSLKEKKADKVRRITAHVCYQKKEDIVSVVNNDSNEDNTSSDFDEESDSDDDIILANHESGSSSEEDDDEYERRKLEADSNQSQSQEGPVPVLTRLPAQTRSGRAIAVPQLRYRDCYFFKSRTKFISTNVQSRAEVKTYKIPIRRNLITICSLCFGLQRNAEMCKHDKFC